MPEEIEKKIRMLEEIRRDDKAIIYLNPFRARERITFLLALIDELTDALFKIHAAIAEAQKHDPNLNPSGGQDADPLPS
jgi:hypothetical protein